MLKVNADYRKQGKRVSHPRFLAVALSIIALSMSVAAPAYADSPHQTERTNDQCTRVAYHNHTYVNSSNGRAWTSIQWQFGNFYDPDCTGYVEVRTSSSAGTYTTTSSSHFIQRNYANAGFNYTDHNAQSSVTGLIWGHRMF